jgi:hypothetical protein
MHDKVKAITEDEVEIRFMSNQSLEKKIEKLKGLLAHENPSLSLSELFHELCDLGIKAWDPGAKNPGAPRKRCATDGHKGNNISAADQREVWRRANSQCELCGSEYALEIDHVQPKALGGSNDLENLRLLCRCCNQRSAIQTFGAEKMGEFLDAKAGAH